MRIEENWENVTAGKLRLDELKVLTECCNRVLL